LDPAYYKGNTVRQIIDMQVDVRYGQPGSGKDDFRLTSPYPYKTAAEHYEAWRRAANGGTKHTLATLPDWDGRWDEDEGWLSGEATLPSTVAAALTPQYREYFVQAQKAAAEGRDRWAGAFCLPEGFMAAITNGPKEFLVRPKTVHLLSASNAVNFTRWVHIDQEHVRPEQRYPRWLGESVGFWDGDALVVHTNQIRNWRINIFEWSDRLETVERYRRVGDVMEAEITLYDPEAFAAPLHAKFRYRHDARPGAEYRLLYNTCTDSNGPSSKVFVNDRGILDERVPGDPGYWDIGDKRPWAAMYAKGEAAAQR
jgi:hypothetical protein